MKNVIINIQKSFKTNLGKQVLNYALFYGVLWIFHLLFVSVITFFHLILNHNIGTIADWIVDRGWIEIALSKVLIFFIAIQFMKVRNIKYALVRGMLRNSTSIPRHESFVAIIFLLLSVIAAGDLQLNDGYIFEIFRTMSSAVGTVIFFGIDLFLILILDVFHPLREEADVRRKIFLFPFLFYFFTRATFIYEQTISLKLYPYFFILMYAAYWRRRNWTFPLLIIFGFFVPAFVFLGLDPVWSKSFSFFYMKHEVSAGSIFLICTLLYFYFEWRKKKFPEYIYRD
jgi:hypothetical protein